MSEFRYEHSVDDTDHVELLMLLSAAFGGIEKLIPANQRWLVRQDGCLVAHAAVQHRWFIVHGEYFEGWLVGNVCTHPNFQRRGIGTQLMRRVTHDLTQQDLKFAVLNCGERWIEFYRSTGYRLISRNGAYLRNGRSEIDEDDPAMAISLKPEFDVRVLECDVFPFGFDF